MAHLKNSNINEAKLQVALQAVITSGLQDNGRPYRSLQSAAKEWDVPKTTLTECWHGHKTRPEAHQERQKLSPAQESVLKDWIRSLGKHGIPLSPLAAAEYASTIIDAPVSVAWTCKFRDRHADLRACWTTALEVC
jgi:hypothetical protein